MDRGGGGRVTRRELKRTEYLRHADLSTVSRYAHFASEQIDAAVLVLADRTYVRRA